MLIIENINKIIGERVVNEWYIKSMHGLVNVIDMNGLHKEVYQIIIQNKITNSEGKIYLHRNYVSNPFGIFCYELSCKRGGKSEVQYITKNTIKNIKELIERIRIVADIN